MDLMMVGMAWISWAWHRAWHGDGMMGMVMKD
jgi:hypothetical protein